MWKCEELVEEGRCLKVQDSQGPRVQTPKVQGSQGPRYLKVTFKYELDSKEGPSCDIFKNHFLKLTHFEAI